MNDTSNFNSEEPSKVRYWSYLFFATILLFFCVFGVTYSFYKSEDSEDNEIETGQIIFTYSDVAQSGNGISIQNATPVSDIIGKSMMGKNQYFDFYITANTKKSSVQYQLLVNKDQKSTLNNNNVRIYLTQVMGGYEQELVFSDFSDLIQKDINNTHYYVLYEKQLVKGLENYSDSFRLRMWVKESAQDYEDQFFSVKIDVYAYQIEG